MNPEKKTPKKEKPEKKQEIKEGKKPKKPVAEKRSTSPKKEPKAQAKKTVKKSKPKMDPEAKKALFSSKIEKVTINIGVGEAGERLKKAETVLESITGHKPIETLSRTTNKDWGLRKRMPIGCKVTLRGIDANEFLKEALSTRENKMADYSFDDEGNLSFGIPDHTLFKSQKYDPNIGIFGMDICVNISKAGYYVKKRRVKRSRIGKNQRVSRDDSIAFIKKTFGIEIFEE